MISEQFGVSYALGVTSGTAALMVAMKALGIGYGDKVIVPGNTFTATAGSVICCNAVPVFAEIDESLTLDPDDLERVLDDDVKAVIPVHINGNPRDMDRINAFARKHRLHEIEDVAQSLGTTYKGRYAGTIGDIGAFSFQMQKLITSGEGGAVVTNSPELFERAVRYHDQGSFREQKRYDIDTDDSHSFAGQNYRMSEITGAVLVEQWKKLDGILASMRGSHRKIRETLAAELPELKLRKSYDQEGDGCSVLSIQLPTMKQAAQFVNAMNAENITCRFMYDGKPVYAQPFILNQRTAERDHFPFNYPFSKPVEYKMGMCPRTEELLNRIPIIQISPLLADSDVEDIITGIIKVYRGLRIHA